MLGAGGGGGGGQEDDARRAAARAAEVRNGPFFGFLFFKGGNSHFLAGGWRVWLLRHASDRTAGI